MQRFFILKEFLRYQLSAKSKYWIHSPFVFSFINEVMNDKRNFYCFDEIEKLRAELVKNNSVIQVNDFGAGTLHGKKSERTISFIAKTSGTPAKYAQLLFRLIEHYQLKNILELGTSHGIATSYFASTAHDAKVISIEGSNSIADEAEKNLKQLALSNAKIIRGEFEKKLPEALSEMKKIDFLFLDGDHRLTSTLSYFNQCVPHLHENSVVVLDDIYWSAEMKTAWQQVCAHQSVTLSIDLFRLGILFFRKDRAKEHFILRY